MAQINLSLPPEQRINELEEQLKRVNQKAEFVESVINVLKNDYGVSMVKKRPGKSSRNVRPQK
ncbi:Mobile element protein [Edwardsiella anguillarum]|uniref:Mobile element protein n=1 Tax=Edwardsiella anguillarum ET080813 TaxID=667120 RepID=A0A076LP34_9GAMM|nr:Mobile element protein [Edwardsiella anguillarum ET080813]BET81764.1 Mobile element protein [Edwardsiella anguillarum]BET85193.1 Mobile element protein [Edwardsiella anguillarum]BET88556.1 Mobile element protein [Edwardsiella anguillarum]BET91847.1 Mobile element protein [Edwardsiella anguillarum]